MTDTQISCPVCGSLCNLLDQVDFNRSCGVVGSKSLGPSGIAISYFLCCGCQFCFAPEFAKWRLEDFAERIYNEDYVLVDPGYLETRPRQSAHSLMSLFDKAGTKIRHLDYGGGNGLVSELLREANWKSISYDPFVDTDLRLDTIGRFDLITAIEVFEHVPDVCGLVKDLSSLLAPKGIVLFTTLLSDGHISDGCRIDWWYAAPRNGHISLFSKKSLTILGAKVGLNFGSFSEGLHAFWTQVPTWASHLFERQ